jgi:phage regulator Rha-like protein
MIGDKMNKNSNTDLIKIFDNEPRISHRIIAKEVFEFDSNKKKTEKEQLKNKMTQIKELITDNIDDFEEFGHLRIETESVKNSVGAVNQEKTYFLNEQQATLLLTFMRNTPKIKFFKKRIVKEFFEMRQLLLNHEASQSVQTSQNLDLDSYISENEKLIKFKISY